MLESLKGFIHEIKGLSNLENKLCDMLNIRNVIVVPEIAVRMKTL